MPELQMNYYKRKKLKTVTKESEKMELSSMLEDIYFHFAQHLTNP